VVKLSRRLIVGIHRSRGNWGCGILNFGSFGVAERVSRFFGRSRGSGGGRNLLGFGTLALPTLECGGTSGIGLVGSSAGFKGVETFPSAFFTELSFLLLTHCHHDGKFLGESFLRRVRWFRSVVNGVSGLGRGYVKIGQVEGMCGELDLVLSRVVCQEDGTEASRVVSCGSFVPGLTKVDIAYGNRFEIRSSAEFAQFLVELQIFGYLSHVNCSMDRVVEIFQKIVGGGDASE